MLKENIHCFIDCYEQSTWLFAASTRHALYSHRFAWPGKIFESYQMNKTADEWRILAKTKALLSSNSVTLDRTLRRCQRLGTKRNAGNSLEPARGAEHVARVSLVKSNHIKIITHPSTTIGTAASSVVSIKHTFRTCQNSWKLAAYFSNTKSRWHNSLCSHWRREKTLHSCSWISFWSTDRPLLTLRRYTMEFYH